MSDYNVVDDLLTIKDLCDFSDTQLAEAIGVTRVTLSRWKANENNISLNNIKAIYEFAFKHGKRLNEIKAQFFKEEYSDKDDVILFHGAKNNITDNLSLSYSKKDNDFGVGFYCGETLEQSAMFVAGYPNSSLYIYRFKRDNNLKCVEFGVDREWMLAIAYFRNKIPQFTSSPTIQKILNKTKQADYIIAPIADNRMFQIIDEFIEGDITDIQCQHALSATNLGKQYVFVTQKALDTVIQLRHCFLAESEKEFYLRTKQEENIIGNDKVKVAKRNYRGQGQYIDQILI